MPVAAPCLKCGAPARGSYCPACEASRPGGRARLRSRRWRRIRQAFLRMNPLCMWPGCYARADEVDHNVPRDQGGTDGWSNLRGYCKHHHVRKTQGDVA